MNDNQNNNPGCLGLLLRLFGVGPSATPGVTGPLPYRVRDDFLSAAERSFYGVLVSAVGGRGVVFCKVRLADIFFVSRPNENAAARNRIDRKHADFLVCDPATIRPLFALELDDASHARPDRQERDAFVEEVFQTAGLPLVRVPAQRAYNIVEVMTLVAPHMAGGPPAPPPSSSAALAPVAGMAPACPSCGLPMVARTASKGERAGEQFWGCPNYPRCRRTVPL